MNESDAERYASWHAVRLVYLEGAPLFTLPRFYKGERFEYGGRKGTLLTLCADSDPDTRGAMEAAGCALLKSSPQYAPEVVRATVFIPAGTPFEYA